MIDIYRLESIEPDTAADIGRIMPFLSERHDGGAIREDLLQATIDSPSAVQLVASSGDIDPSNKDLVELTERYPIIGAATLSTLHGALGEKAWLEDFVVVPQARKLGVAQGLWDAMSDWRRENGLVQMRFNSTANRERAHGFYLKNGCQELAVGRTTLFAHTLKI